MSSLALFVVLASVALAIAFVLAATVHPHVPLFQRARFALVVSTSVAAWMAIYAVAAGSGLLGQFQRQPPPMAIMFVVTMVGSLSVAFGPVGGTIARNVPVAWLIGFQAFRLPLEILMHQSVDDGIVPWVMTFSGYNFDIVIGASALPVAVLAQKGTPRPFLIAWNILGIVSLAVIAVVAMTSSPMFHLFGDDLKDMNIWVTKFPYCWVPAVLVASAIIGHISCLRALKRTPTE